MDMSIAFQLIFTQETFFTLYHHAEISEILPFRAFVKCMVTDPGFPRR